MDLDQVDAVLPCKVAKSKSQTGLNRLTRKGFRHGLARRFEETVPSHKGTCVERQRQDAKMKVQSEYVLQSFDAVSDCQSCACIIGPRRLSLIVIVT